MSDTTGDGPPMPPSRRVNNYELLREIGSGGMSRVYRARKVGTDELVAIKVIRIEDVAADFERRLRREPEVQRGLGHDNIVQFYDWFRLGDEFFLVMELVDGRSLSQIIHRESGPLPLPRARLYMRQVLRAVEHLHSLGIIHRDIKPGNILVRHDDVVKLADFGIAKFTWQQGETKTQKGLGTPEYMSPEQARGKQIDYRTDIYSLGITLFEMLTARKPFAREEETPMAYVEVIQEILAKPLPDPRAFVPGIPSGVVRLMNRAAAKNPNDRFQSASEMLGALEIVEDDDYSPPTVVPNTPLNPFTADISDSSYSAPTRVPTASDEGLVESPAIQPPVRSQPERLDVPPNRSSPVLWIVLVLMLMGVGGYFGYQWYQQQRHTSIAHLTDDDAAAVAGEIAADYEEYARTSNPPALVSLYAEKNVDYFRLKKTTRQAILDDSEKFYDQIESTSQLEVEVKKSRAVNDSTIDTEWIITYQRVKNDGTLLRGVTSNQFRLEYIDGGWLITRQQQNWIKRDNVAPPPDTPNVVDVQLDTVAETLSPEQPAQTPAVQNPVSQPQPQTKKEVVGAFLRTVDAGSAAAAWDRNVSSKMKSGEDRVRFLDKFAGQHVKALEINTDGEKVVATVGQPGADGYSAMYRMVFTFVEQNGPKIDAIEITTLSNR